MLSLYTTNRKETTPKKEEAFYQEIIDSKGTETQQIFSCMFARTISFEKLFSPI